MIGREQRHTKTHRCPICDGADGDPRGLEKRCHGFTVDEWCRCSREEYAGNLDPDNSGLFVHRLVGQCRCGKQHGEAPSETRLVEPVATYPYEDESGRLLFQVVRFPNKAFRIRTPDGSGGWHWKMNGAPRVLYRLPELIRADSSRPVFIVEGERDVETLRSLGAVATCNPHGAGKWGMIALHAKLKLRGRHVVVWADRDEPGYQHARDILGSLRGVASIYAVQCPAPYKDATDLFKAGLFLDALEPLSDPSKASGPANDVASPATSEAPPTVEPVTLWGEDLAKPLPPVPWLCEGLTIGPGRATVFAGEGGTRKGWWACAMQLCGAAERKLLGRFQFKEGLRSVYFDYEQTERVSRERYQLLALGLGLDLASLGKRIGYRWRPIPTMAPRSVKEMTQAIDALCWHTEGLDLAFVDSVRACSPGIEENSVFASIPFDLATAVSERTGVAFAFNDHSGKPTSDPANARARKHAQRGHSSKLDACQSLFVFSAKKGQPTLVSCERSQTAAETAWPKDFQFTLQVSQRGGLELVEIGMVQEIPGSPNKINIERLSEAVFMCIVQNPEISSNELVTRVGRKAQDVRAARDFLVRLGKVENRGTKREQKWVAKT